jgi:hypothetical protein
LLKTTSRLASRVCDEGVLVFDEKTGKTSLLNHQGALTLSALSPEQGVDETAVRLASGMAKEDDYQAFQALISSLENSGLIVRC